MSIASRRVSTAAFLCLVFLVRLGQCQPACGNASGAAFTGDIGYFQVLYVSSDASTIWPAPPQNESTFLSTVLDTTGIGDGQFNVSVAAYWNVRLFILEPMSVDADATTAARCAVQMLNESHSFLEDYNVTTVNIGNPPIPVPSYLRQPVEEHSTPATIMGGIGIFFAVVQLVYGLYYWRFVASYSLRKGESPG